MNRKLPYKSNTALHHAEKLLKLASKNNSGKIYNILNNIKGSTKYKGDVFEHFLAKLYEETGWMTTVCGGKGDKGVDILLYRPNHPSKIHAIVQTKNLKTRLSKKSMRHEYANFFGDEFSCAKGASEKYGCKKLIIISLNGYAEEAKKFSNPKPATHKVYCYEWAYVESLVQKYSKAHPRHRGFRIWDKYIYHNIIALTRKRLAGITFTVVTLLIFIAFLPTVIFHSHQDMLTDEMTVRLNKTYVSSLARKECKNLNYPVDKCREKLVHRYTKAYGSLKNGLMAHFCGPTNFKQGQCRSGEKKALYVITGE